MGAVAPSRTFDSCHRYKLIKNMKHIKGFITRIGWCYKILFKRYGAIIVLSLDKKDVESDEGILWAMTDSKKESHIDDLLAMYDKLK